MNKYSQIFKISFAQEFAYKVNFIMWRARNVIQVLLAYYLWSAVFADPQTTLFGYDQEKILTYVFAMILIRSLVFSARSVDVPQEISEGSLTNYLVRPIAYFKYWFVRDFSSKALNFVFSIGEFVLLAIVFRPPIFIQSNILFLFLFLITILIANYLIFVIRFIVTSITFWVPELAWGGQFLFMVIITEFLSGSIFPLDIFPALWQKIFNYLPFPYLIFFPLQVYLGKISLAETLRGILVSVFWSFGLTYILRAIWQKGLRLYDAVGR